MTKYHTSEREYALKVSFNLCKAFDNHDLRCADGWMKPNDSCIRLVSKYSCEMHHLSPTPVFLRIIPWLNIAAIFKPNVQSK